MSLAEGPDVSNAVDALILNLLEWIGPIPRAYSEVMDAWRTSCPRLPVWEEANARGFIQRHYQDGDGAMISVTILGKQFLNAHRVRQSAPGLRSPVIDPPNRSSKRTHRKQRAARQRGSARTR
jgi:hypothetical protein